VLVAQKALDGATGCSRL